MICRQSSTIPAAAPVASQRLLQLHPSDCFSCSRFLCPAVAMTAYRPDTAYHALRLRMISGGLLLVLQGQRRSAATINAMEKLNAVLTIGHAIVECFHLGSRVSLALGTAHTG